ncbi:MAG: type II secretion system protein, partial [Candidatus Omnitrophica bacterium]|nr:type II secretion system protein [Candidatus Omnitrophota bacterium]
MRDTRGFTLLEAVLIIAILGIIVTAISPLFRTVVEGRDEQDRRLELLQASRIGMDEMVRNIRTATVFTTANASRIDFENWNAVDIEYKLTGNVLKKDNNVLLENVDNLTFTYYDTEGNVT